MSPKETLEKAYGNVPKEAVPNLDLFNWMPTNRGIKYYWLKFIRKIRRL